MKCEDVLFAIIIGLLLGAILYPTHSRSQTTYQPIAQCQAVAKEYSENLHVPLRVGAVDSSRMPSYHPCKFAYFERECRQAAYAHAMRACVVSHETYRR